MKKIIVLFSALFALAYNLEAQPINRPSNDKLLEAAKEAEANSNPYLALENYTEIYEDQRDNTLIPKLAELNYELRDYSRAERLLRRIILRDRKGEYTEYQYLYAMCMKHEGNYADAIDMFKRYISDGASDSLKMRSELEIEGCEMARKNKDAEGFVVENLGRKVNSPQTESSPSMSSDGQLYFTSLQDKKVIVLDGKEGDWYSKVYTTQKGDDAYSEPTPLDTKINRDGFHQGNVSITPDGETMYFTRVGLESQVISESKIYYSIKKSDGWGGANEVAGVNGDYIAKHPCEGELFGEKVLFFVANLPGGEGGDDIYYAPKKTDGVFGAPVNLGSVINTPADEVTPFYQDGKLFFSSNGFPSYGGLDVFVSQWNGTVWSKPENLGAGINSSVDDQFYSQTADGYNGYFVSNRPGPNNLKSKTCCDDIYVWEKERLKMVVNAQLFRLRTKDEKKSKGNYIPLAGAQLQLVDVTDPVPTKVKSFSNPQGNTFELDLEPERSYLIVALKDGFKPDTTKINTVGLTKTITKDEKIVLRLDRKPPPPPTIYRRNEPIRLNNIYYDFDDDKILPDAEKDLAYLVELMEKYPDMVIELSSHTDARGNDSYNKDLSQRRANSAKTWMVEKGVAEDRIVPKGYGEEQILNECKNGVKCEEEQHKLNRRTEFKIISGPTMIEVEADEPAEGQNPGGKQSAPAFFDVLEKILNEEDTLSPNDAMTALANLVMKFEEESINFGTVEEGEYVSVSYPFENIAPVPINITIVSACDCMSLDWTRGEIAPGQKAKVDITLDTRKRPGALSQDIDVILEQENEEGYPIVKRLVLTGQIDKVK